MSFSGCRRINYVFKGVQCAGAVAQLLSAGVVLEDVMLQNVFGNSKLLAALGPAAGTLESLHVHRLDGFCNLEDARDMKVSRICQRSPTWLIGQCTCLVSFCMS